MRCLLVTICRKTSDKCFTTVAGNVTRINQILIMVITKNEKHSKHFVENNKTININDKCSLHSHYVIIRLQ